MSDVRSAVQCKSEIWYLRKKTILRRIEKARIRDNFGVKLIKSRSSKELLDLVGLEETLSRLAKAIGGR